MLTADWIAIALLVLFALLGFILGFGRGLRFFTKGFFGFVISVFICYSLGGLIIKLGFVQTLLSKFVNLLSSKGGFCKFLLLIRIDIIVYYLSLFIIVQILRIIIVKIVSRIFEIKNVFLKAINRVVGAVLFCSMLFLITIIVFQIIYIIGGNTAVKFTSFISGSKIGLEWLYTHNPLTTIVEFLFRIEIRIPVTVS